MEKPVKDIDLDKSKDSDKLVRAMHDAGGFTAKKLGVGVDILETMCKDNDCTKFLSFPAAIIATGTRGVVRDLVKNKLVDVLVTTCGTLDHDLSRTWKDYYHGSFDMDDAKLRRQGINRLGNVLVPNESHGMVIEDKLQPMLEEFYKQKKEWSVHELIKEIGLKLDNENSILYWAAKNDIPVFAPGIASGTFGYHLWLFYQSHPDFRINILGDEDGLDKLIHGAKKTGALMVGGGISKHHTIWWNQFRGGLDYAVYITTAPEWDGSLSGARVREGISWGKVSEKAKYVTIEGEATVLLPLMVSSLLERIKR